MMIRSFVGAMVVTLVMVFSRSLARPQSVDYDADRTSGATKLPPSTTVVAAWIALLREIPARDCEAVAPAWGAR